MVSSVSLELLDKLMRESGLICNHNHIRNQDKDYHIDCYCCEECGLQLTDEEPNRSYPLDNHLFCHSCHIRRLSAMQANMSLN